MILYQESKVKLKNSLFGDSLQILYVPVPVITAYNTSYVAYLKDGKGGKNARSYLLLKGGVESSRRPLLPPLN